MRRLLLLGALLMAALNGTGCVPIAAWGQLRPDDPNRRLSELIGVAGQPSSEGELQGERIGFTDQPAHLPPERVHGGVQ